MSPESVSTTWLIPPMSATSLNAGSSRNASDALPGHMPRNPSDRVSRCLERHPFLHYAADAAAEPGAACEQGSDDRVDERHDTDACAA